MTQVAVDQAEAVVTQLFGTPEGRRDPYPLYQRLRDLAAIHVSPSFGALLTRYADCLAVMHDPRLIRGYTLTQDVLHPDWRERPSFVAAERWLLMLDGADHTRLRRLVSKAFTPRTVERLRPRIEAMVDELLGPIAEAGGGEFMAELAFALPVRVIAELLGVPREDCEPFRAWTSDIVAVLEVDAPAERLDAADRAQLQVTAYFDGLLNEKQKHPADDLISELLAVESDGDRLTRDEIISLASLLFGAGFETTTNLAGNGLLGLLRHPDQLELLRDDPALATRLPDELLRYDGTVQLVPRLAAEQVTVGDVTLPAGTPVMAVVGAGNHDPARYEQPDRLDLRRKDIRPLTFGGGVHFCLGAALARLEIEILFGKLATRFGVIELVGDTPYRDTLTLRGPMQVPITVKQVRRESSVVDSAVPVPVPVTAPVVVGSAAGPGALPLRPPDGDDLAWRNRYRRHRESAASPSPDTAQVAALFGRIGFFGGCSEAELNSLASTAFPIAFAPGELLCAAGAEALECYVLAEGSVSVRAEGKQLATLGADDVVGERGPVLGTPRSADVVAMTHVNAYAISRDRLQRLLAESARARAGVEDALAKRYAGPSAPPLSS
jgi:cytochrome P450